MSSLPTRFENAAQQLSDKGIDLTSKYLAALEIRDFIDSFHNSAEYEAFLRKFIPIFMSILESGQPSFFPNSIEHKLRNIIFNILYRLPINEDFKPYAFKTASVLTNLLRVEDEENGVICMKFISALHRSYREELEGLVSTFLNLVIEMYKNMHVAVKDCFDSSSSLIFQSTAGGSTATSIGSITNIPTATTPTPTSTPTLINNNSVNNIQTSGSTDALLSQSANSRSQSPADTIMTTNLNQNENTLKQLPRSMYSFKVLTECPIIVVTLLTSHKEHSGTYLAQFVPYVIDMLNLQAQPQMEARLAAESRGEIYTSVAPGIKNRQTFGDFITAQVKTMSFLAYVLQRRHPLLDPYKQLIPELVVRLLEDCPRELSASRKELLVATRHILSSECRVAFIPKIDLLLNGKVLIGDGLTVHETLRPLAYSMVADLVHNVRSELSTQQLWETVKVYCENMQDSTLSVSFHVMSAKLLLNLVERIIKLPDKAEGRQLMVFIVNAFAEKFAQLNRMFENSLLHSRRTDSGKEAQSKLTNVNVQDDKPSLKDLDLYDTRSAYLIKTHLEFPYDRMKDGRNLFKALMTFLRSIMFGLKSCNPPPPFPEVNPTQWNESARGLSFEEIEIFRKLFCEGIKGFSYYAILREIPEEKRNKGDPYPLSQLAASKEEKELMETFVTVFIHIDSSSFIEIIEPKMPFFYNAIMSNGALLAMVQFFLASELTSTNFLGMLLDYLLKHLHELGTSSNVKATVIIRLFRLSFMAVNLFPTVNELMLLPHLQNMIINSLTISTKAEEPLNYFHLLRTLFRSIGGGRFELLYNEVLPLLHVLLETLNKLLQSARRPQERDLFVELCLTVPVRLSVLVPHLSYLMRPLVIALKGSPELIAQGLRTLELCVDNLTAEYFDPILEPVIDNVMEALWSHLKPLPYSHQYSHTTLRILGKLGGRNRRFLKPPSDLKFKQFTESNPSVLLKLNGLNAKHSMDLIAPVLDIALDTLYDFRCDSFYRIAAFRYIVAVTKLFINSGKFPKNYGKVVKLHIKSLIDSETVFPSFSSCDAEKAKPMAKLELQVNILERALHGILFAGSIPDIREEVEGLVIKICELFSVLEIEHSIYLRRQVRQKDFSYDDDTSRLFIDTRIITSSIANALSSYNDDARDIAILAVKTIYKSSFILFNKSDYYTFKHSLVKSLILTFSHTCYKPHWYNKSGGVIGLRTILECPESGNPPIEWLEGRLVELVRTLYFVFKDVPEEAPSKGHDDANYILLKLLRCCFKDNTEQEKSVKLLQQLCGFLIYELSNPSDCVRDSTKEALQLLSEISNKSLSELLNPVKSTLLTPIFAKPLRALPFSMQIGNIDAMIYCLKLPNSFVACNEELQRLFMEVLALADADDESLASGQRTSEYKVADSLVRLRVKCIDLLSLALCFTDLVGIQNASTRSRIIAVFFKNLYVKSEKIVNASFHGLETVLSQNHKLPKDLLQNGLRPILVNLSDHKRLSVPGLNGLARLLQLLTTYFKVEIGNKLFDHARAWTDKVSLYSSSNSLLSTQNNINIIIAIFNIYHLLPNSANRFMEDLIQLCVTIENYLRRMQLSPFRIPLGLYCNKYAEDSFLFFSSRLSDRKFGQLFTSLVDQADNTDLRSLVRNRMPELEKIAFSIENKELKVNAILTFIQLFKVLSSYDSEWLLSNKELLTNKLLNSAPSIKGVKDSVPLTSPLHMSVKIGFLSLHGILVSYMAINPKDYDVLFNLLDIIANGYMPMTPILQYFIFDSIVKSKDYEKRKKYLFKSIEFVGNKSACLSSKILIFRQIVNPVLVHEAELVGNLDKLLEDIDHGENHEKDTNWIDKVHNLIWKNPVQDSDDSSEGSIDQYRFELLQMTATLIKFGSSLIADTRKDIIKFSWNFIKLEDVISKKSVYEVIAYFIASYETPSKIVVQIYVALLKAQHNEGKILVRRALDILAPHLPLRIESSMWAKWPRRVLAEDGHNPHQVTNVYLFIVRHADLFFESREHFCPLIINAIPKLGFLNGSPSDHATENQILSIDLAELILKWEAKRKELLLTRPKSKIANTGQQSESSEKSNDNSNDKSDKKLGNKSDKKSGDKLNKKPVNKSDKKLIDKLDKSNDKVDNSSENKLEEKLDDKQDSKANDKTEDKVNVKLEDKTSSELDDKSNDKPNNKDSHSNAIDVSSNPLKRKAHDLDDTLSEQKELDYQLPFQLKEALITYLIRFVCVSTKNVLEVPLIKRVLNLLSKFLSSDYWPDVNVRLSFFERTLVASEHNELNIVPVINALEVVNITLQRKHEGWILASLEQLEKLLEKCIKSEYVKVQESLHRVLSCILKNVVDAKGKDGETPESVTHFISMITNVIQENLVSAPPLSSNATMAIQDTANNIKLLAPSILLAWTLIQYKPAAINPVLPLLMKAFGRLCKEYLLVLQQAVQQTHAIQHSGSHQQASNSANENNVVNIGEENYKILLSLLGKLIDIGQARISILEDLRRTYLSVIERLVERCNDADLCFKLLEIARQWIFGKKDLFPTIKEKTTILSKMIMFETRDNVELTRSYYRLVTDIYEDTSLLRTDLTVRMEQAFLIGTKIDVPDIRSRLLKILSDSIDSNIWKRLLYIIRDQSWENIGDSLWLNQALQLLYGAVDDKNPISLQSVDFRILSFRINKNMYPELKENSKIDNDNGIDDTDLEKLLERQKIFSKNISEITASELLRPLTELQYHNPEAVRVSWLSFFPTIASSINKRDNRELFRSLLQFLSKDYHNRQMNKRPNVMQIILEGFSRCGTHIKLPPHLVKFLGQAFDGWYSSIQILELNQTEVDNENQAIKYANIDALTEIYASLNEDDMFYGLWRRRCEYVETNIALSYEQIGIWDKAQQMYESAQIKARSGALPYSEEEYSLWEDHWILCEKKLQQWDILTEIAKHEGFTDLLLECAWRMADWTADRVPLEQSIKSVMDVPTPRRQVFESFMILQKCSQKLENISDLSKCCDEGMQLSMRKWHTLPSRITPAHIPLLGIFQQYVELMEASQIYTSLASTNVQNMEAKSHDLRSILQAWRERLPNVWDDINLWSDLVTWRQNVFSVINKVYMPLLASLQNSGLNNSSTNSHAYRGHHEIAWIVNRFAHVARLHDIPKVCIDQLTKIYTLPNIEIQEAFLKLREQAKCHYQNPNELNTGLEVISNTNLLYFGAPQKAEFFTLKGMFLAKLNLLNDANQSFATAVQMDLHLPKAWAEWGYFNDKSFKENPKDLSYASSAISCYLQAAGLYKNGKARKLLGRILWLVGLDDSTHILANAFESYRGDVPIWYWVTYIPQLLTSLSHHEARIARQILIKMAKSYPQALHFQLRTTKEDYAVIKAKAARAAQDAASRNAKAENETSIQKAAALNKPIGTPNEKENTPATDSANSSNNLPVGAPKTQEVAAMGSPALQNNSGTPNPTSNVGEPNNSETNNSNVNNAAQPNLATGQIYTNTPGQNTGTINNPPNISTNPTENVSSPFPVGHNVIRQPWEYVDEIMGILKTAYPLLALSLETMVDQIYQRFKILAEEEAYRLLVALHNDAVLQLSGISFIKEDPQLSQLREDNLLKFANNVLPTYMKNKFLKDFVNDQPTYNTYFTKLRKWRDSVGEILDRRKKTIELETLSPHLAEFHYQKFEEVEIPGQYLLMKDNNVHFIKIARFMPEVRLVRMYNLWCRRITIQGHDGSLHPFAVQYPSARHCRREERIIQLLRILNGMLTHKVRSRRRNMCFTLSCAIPLSPHIRLIQDEDSHISMQTIYEDWCRSNKKYKEDPILFSIQKFRSAMDSSQPNHDVASVKMEIMHAIQTNMVPNNILYDHFIRTYKTYEDFWLFRKQFSYQYASVTFISFMLCINYRYPHKVIMDYNSGNVWATDMLPSLIQHNQAPAFQNPERVPFRLTPNLQTLMGPTCLEGIFSSSVMIIAKCLSENDFDLEQYLSLFVRDEVITWYTQQRRPSVQGSNLRDIVRFNIEIIVKRTSSLSQVNSNKLPANQTIIDLISKAVSPRDLALTDNLYMAYY